MRLARTKAVLLIFVFAASFAFAAGPGARAAYACSCAGIQSPVEELEFSDAVFVGEVVELGVEAPRYEAALGGVEFRVEQAWKGVSERSVVIYGQGDNYGTNVTLDCHYQSFDRGRSYLVYADGVEGDGDGPLVTSTCGRTGPLAAVEADLRALGPPETTLPDTGGTPLPGIAAVAVISLVLFGALVGRR